MTISNSDRTAGPFIGNGNTNTFPFTFKIFSRSDLLVATTSMVNGEETILTLDADYSVAMNADQTNTPGGTITTSINLAAGSTLSMTSNIANVQNLDLTNNGGFYPAQINGALDRIVVMVQQLAARVGGNLNIGGAAAVQTVAKLATSAGTSLIGFIQAGVGAVPITLQNFLRASRVTPGQFGAVGDGVTNDTAALKAMFATGRPWYIPYKQNGYLFNDTLTIAADGDCDGFLIAAAGFAKTAITFADPGYGSKRIVRCLEVKPTTVRQAGSLGIQVDYPNIVLDRCRAPVFDIGVQLRSYSIMLLNCSFQLCNTNLSCYAPSSSQEINDIKIIGGNYDSAIQYATRLGDPRFPSTVAAGNPHGVSILIEGANFDGAKVTVDRVFSLRMTSTYHEGSDSGNAIEIGGSGNNNCRDVVIGPSCYFSRLDYAVYLNNSVLGLIVEPNYYAVNYSALYAINVDVSGFVYRKGYANGFNAPEVHTGFTNTSVSALMFSDITIERDYLINGVQVAPNRTSSNNWYPYGKTLDGWTHLSSASGRFRNTVQTINGNFVGGAFVCTTKTDALKFNGGDRVTASLGGTSFVRYVDYVGGIIYVDGAILGAGTLSHSATASFIGEALSGNGSPEGVVTAPKGSIYRNIGASGSGLYVKDSGTGNTGWAGK